MNNNLQIHKAGEKVIHVPRIPQKLLDAVNRCAKAERKSQRDWCIDALQDSINSSPVRLGMQRIERRLTDGVPSRPDEIAPVVATLAERRRWIGSVNEARAIVADQKAREGGTA